jgi:hypothetical protein
VPKVAKGIEIGLAAVIVVVVLIALLFQKQKEDSRRDPTHPRQDLHLHDQSSEPAWVRRTLTTIGCDQGVAIATRPRDLGCDERVLDTSVGS